ncbi:hypothetical protein PHAVU_009G261300 [Phaseolus vulgaris]|uniref:RING-type E3 ubiquitin transferase n=1 Tax=Phaseolus vulgaris TaxID=3885 RepID=V7AZH0_PHAVU|nr:hypothetical protein PHAVU_009G261300g [Phaseolus vulgaris]ESW11052.1 hypothetical protein PHAVU_009G261300g [Phaseolus vulgaris]
MITTLISMLTVTTIVLVLKIPRLLQNNKLYRRNYSKGDCCSVCLCQISDGGKIRTLPGCHHSFHLHCIAPWFNNHSTCPLCRNNITLLDNNRTHSLLHFFSTFSDIFIALHYLVLLPTATNRDTFPLFH